MSYGGLRHPNLDTSCTFFVVGLFEDTGVHPNYKLLNAGRLHFPHKAALEIYLFYVYSYIDVRTVLKLGKPNVLIFLPLYTFINVFLVRVSNF